METERAGVASSQIVGLLDDLIEGCQVIDRDWRYVYVNRAAARHGRTTPEALIGRTMMECYPGIDGTPLFATMRACMETREPRELVNRFEFPDGDSGWFELRVQPVPAGIFILSADVTARFEAEAALLRSREAYRTLVESLEDVVYAVDAEGRISYLSPSIVRYGYSVDELLGEPLAELVVAEDRGRLRALLEARRGDGDPAAELRIVDATGSIHHVRASCRASTEGLPQRVSIGILHDVTAERRAEAQLSAAQRLDSIGRLAGGIAHDFNNLLSVVLSHASFALDMGEPVEPVRRDVEEIVAAAERAAELTRQLLAFGRKQVLRPEELDLNALIQSQGRAWSRLLGDGIELELRLDERLGRVRLDPGQVEQVLLNLVVNARDAMPGGGRLIVESRDVDVDADFAARHLGVPPGPFVCVAVSDDGQGMDAATRARIFEPFFTTKRPGQGTGLGLATAFGIVKQSGGSIWCYSEPGRGTAFKLYFPRVPADPTRVQGPLERRLGPSRGPCVLVIDDALEVRTAARRILGGAGYEVVLAASPAEALEHVATHHGPIALALTDVVLPGSTGPELVDRMRALRPELRAVYMSGYGGRSIAEQGLLEPGAPLVTKPFGAVELTRRVREALERTDPS